MPEPENAHVGSVHVAMLLHMQRRVLVLRSQLLWFGCL